MPDEIDWEEKAANTLKAELKRQGMTYADLALRMYGAGSVTNQERNIRNKLSRGAFSAAFMLQCLDAIGVHTLRLSEQD